MSDEVFLYSEDTGDDSYTNMVTAEDMNNIAIDLGNAQFNYFSDEAEYAVDELNGITAALVTKGILLTGNRCKVTWDDTNKKISIAEGVCIFDNGAKKRITSPINLDIIDGKTGGTNYLYLLNNREANSVSVVNSLSEPTTTDDFVMLAEISESGIVLDKREYSSAKYADEINYTHGGKRYSVDCSGMFLFPSLASVEDKENPYTIQATFTLPFIPTYVIMHEPRNYRDDLSSGKYAVKVANGIFFDDLIGTHSEYMRLELNGYDVTVSTYRHTTTGSSCTSGVQLIFV